MQRWWYSDDKFNSGDKVQKSRKSPTKKSELTKKWKFSVFVNQDLNLYEKIALTGNCDELGNWDSDQSVLLTQENGESLSTLSNITRA